LKVIEEFGITADHHKKYLAIAIIKMNSEIINSLTNSKKLLEFIKRLDITDNFSKKYLVIAIIMMKPGIIKDLESSEKLLLFIKKLGITDDAYKKDLATAIIGKKPDILGSNKEEKGKGLSELIKAFGNDFHHNVNSICDLLKGLPQTVVIDFKTLNNNLYQDDYCKKELILEAINKRVINQDNFLSCGFDEIKTEDIYLEILAKAKMEGIVTNKDLFNNLQNQIPQYYSSLKSVLQNKKVEDVIKEKEITNIAKFIYGNNPQNSDIDQLKKKNPLSLISFCDFFNNNTIIASSLKEDVAEQLKSSFQPIGFNTINNREIDNIASLIGKDPESLKKSIS
ncbi:MAG: hypothetical protein LW595_01355, partial [Rickettsiales bacterium]|nr:hypothetical protein [Rickettsiales bacterium]